MTSLLCVHRDSIFFVTLSMPLCVRAVSVCVQVFSSMSTLNTNVIWGNCFLGSESKYWVDSPNSPAEHQRSQRGNWVVITSLVNHWLFWLEIINIFFFIVCTYHSNVEGGVKGKLCRLSSLLPLFSVFQGWYSSCQAYVVKYLYPSHWPKVVNFKNL